MPIADNRVAADVNGVRRPPSSEPSKHFYGWVIAGMGVLGNAIQGGLIFWTMGLYTSTFEDHFNAPRSRITLMETFLTVGVNLLSPFIGALVDKRSARHVVAIGMAALGCGLMLVSFAGTLLQIWLVFLLLIPFGVLAIGIVPSSALIARWFRRRRGFALGLSVTGSSIGGFIAPPLLTWMFMAYGWRTALLVTGVVVIALAPLMFRWLANYPQDIGLEQEPEDPRAGHALTAADQVDWSIKQLLRTRAFWLQTVVSGCMLCVTLGLLANLSLHAKDLGFVGQQTALLYSTIALCSFIGKLSFGYLTDRIGLKPTGALSLSLMSLGLLLMLLVQQYALLLIACVVVGLAVGGTSPIWSNMAARGFGAKSLGRAMGLQNPLHIPITAPSAPLAGYISDTTGSYDLVFIVYIGLMGVAGIALFLLRQPGLQGLDSTSSSHS